MSLFNNNILMSELYNCFGVEGLNIEVDLIGQRNPQSIFVNLLRPLDCHFTGVRNRYNGEQLNTLNDVNIAAFEYKESIINHISERYKGQLNMTFIEENWLKDEIVEGFDVPSSDALILTSITWYIDHVSQLTGIKSPTLMIHSMRGSSGRKQLNWFRMFINRLYNETMTI